MPSKARKALYAVAGAAASLLALSAVADAQTTTTDDPNLGYDPRKFPKPLELVTAPPVVMRQPLSDSDAANLNQALESAKRGDLTGARTAIALINDPLGRKIGTWAFVDVASDQLSAFEIDQARRDLAGWPRAARRQAAAEKLLETSGQSPQQIINWFGGDQPATAQGAMALAAAYRATGERAQADRVIRKAWREKMFEADVQRSMLARFGDCLSQEDHIRRLDMILYGQQGPAARDMLDLVPADWQALGRARIALRSGQGGAMELASSVPASVQNNAGLAFERAAFYRRRGLDTLALGLVSSFPSETYNPEMAERIWDERYPLLLSAIKNNDAQGAYRASANSGLTSGGDAADAEFFAGWVALTKLKQPLRADSHFAALEKIGSSPITRGRALYWRGRAHEANGDAEGARAYYAAAAKYNMTFYGQLAGEKVGDGRLVIGQDPTITQADRARFEGRETVRAARVLYEIGAKDLFKTFVLAIDDTLPSAEEQAQLVDLVRGYGDQYTSMLVVRTAAQRGFTLPQRGYPFRTPPEVGGAPETALILGITRQESGFDPLARSPVGARGMMQLMPSTATIVARRMGVGYSPSSLDDPEYNMRLGSSYLGEMVGTFSGSYVMAVAAYNAGPGRPMQWSAFCGDPRGGGTDPIDFIECIPFSETRNYVMRVLEGMQVYRAKLNGGTAPITLSTDLRRGGYTYQRPTEEVASAGR